MSKAVDAAWQFVRQRRLHDRDNPYVDLSPLYDDFCPVYESLTELNIYGYAFFPKHGPVSLKQPAEIHIHAGLCDSDRRLVYAHEIGEYLAGNLATPLTAHFCEREHQRAERHAWQAASILLIPGIAIERGKTEDRIAALAQVPEWLVRLYREAHRGGFY